MSHIVVSKIICPNEECKECVGVTNFCAECGTKLSFTKPGTKQSPESETGPGPPQVPVREVICPHCNEKTDLKKFCGDCGESLVINVPVKKPAPRPGKLPVKITAADHSSIEIDKTADSSNPTATHSNSESSGSYSTHRQTQLLLQREASNGGVINPADAPAVAVQKGGEGGGILKYSGYPAIDHGQEKVVKASQQKKVGSGVAS